MKDTDIFGLNLEANRLKTFKKWPYKSPDNCTKEKMAAAGFYFKGNKKEPDLACCFICLKELDGWEPQDDPMDEHRSHAPDCFFVKNNIKESELTYDVAREMECERQIMCVTKILDKKMNDFLIEAELTRKAIEKLG